MNKSISVTSQLDNFSHAAYVCDTSGRIIYYNNAAASLWGRIPPCKKNQWLGAWKTADTKGNPLLPEQNPVKRTLLEKTPCIGEQMVIIRPDGSSRVVNPIPSPVFDSKGILTGVITILIDSENTGIQENESTAYLHETPVEAVFIFDQSGNFLSVNQAGCGLLGYNQAELSVLNLFDVIPAVYTGKLPLKLSKLQNGNMVLLERLFTKRTGESFYAEVKAQLLPNGNIQAIVRDITSRKNTEQKIIRSIEKYHIHSKATTDIIWDWDIANNRMYYNEGISKMLGYEATEIVNLEQWWKLKIHPEDYERVMRMIDEKLKYRNHDFILTYRFKSADDSYRFIYDRVMIIYDHKGNAHRMAGVMQDVTYQKDKDTHIAQLIFEAQESIKQQIGTELHDNVNQILTGCLLNLSTIKSVSAEKAAALAELSREHILTAIEELRKLSHTLVPATHNKNTLKELLEKLITAMNMNAAFSVRTEIDNEINSMLTEELQLNLFRILQEQFTNIIRYSGASEVEISVKQINHNLLLRIYDNGIGFNPEEVKPGIGLSNIRRRVKLLKGKFTLKSAAGKGCELVAQIPFEQQKIAA